MPIESIDFSDSVKMAIEFRKIVENLEQFYLKNKHHFLNNFTSTFQKGIPGLSVLKRLLSRIELEIDSISVRMEDDISIIDHPVAIELKINNIALKHKTAYFEFINISTNQVTKKNTTNDDICLILKISNISA